MGSIPGCCWIHNWSVWCQYNVTWLVRMWAYDMLDNKLISQANEMITLNKCAERQDCFMNNHNMEQRKIAHQNLPSNMVVHLSCS